MKKLSLLFFSIVAFAISSCKDNPKQTEPEVVTVNNTEPKTHVIAESAVEFNDPTLKMIFEVYLQIEAALVNTDAPKTASIAAKLREIVQEVEAEKSLQDAAIAIATTNDIEEQRKNFETLSSEVETLLTGNIKSGTLYKQYCPMAFNNKGAYWISSSEAILNPYFGDKMLKCGRVDSEIK